MKGTTKSKVVTSGRLKGRAKAQPARRLVTPNPRPGPSPEPAYSLYSTNSEDQVTSLHKGLDRCAALLSGILQDEKAEAMESFPRAVKGGGEAKSRPSASLGKKTIKKLPTQTGQKRYQSIQHGPGSTTPRTAHPSVVPAAHLGVKLHPPPKHPQTLQQYVLPPSSPPPDQGSCQSVQRGLGSTTPTTAHRSAVPAAHAGVKLHPPQKQPQTLQQYLIPPSRCQTLSPITPPPQSQTTIPPPQTSIPPLHPTPHSGRMPLPQTGCQSASEAPHIHRKEEFEEDFVPVRDINTQSTASDIHTAGRQIHSHVHTCSLKISNMQLEPGQLDKVPQDTPSRGDCSETSVSAETDVKMKTVQYLLGELKALISGQGNVAERLLSILEQTVSSPLTNVGSNIQTEPQLLSLHSQNTQLHRCMRILHQQLKEREKAERQQTLCNSEVLSLQEELTTAESRLQELQDDLTGLQKALQDTQSQLRDREAENALIKTDLEATRSRLLDSEREKSELALLAQQRLEEIGHLKRTLQSQNSSDCPTVVDSSVSDTHFDQHQHRSGPTEPPTDRITQYLMSLGQLEPTHNEHAHVDAEREGNTLEQKKLTSVQLREALSQPDVRSQQGDKPAETAAHQVQSCGQQRERERERERGRLLNSMLSQCDVESVWSDWSAKSGSTFDTRDEAAFRDGLSALDASIASLQRTIQLDLGR
ncbi:coiled-coil domain-containing protein 14 [Chaetodon trifascialis]|uniref:coiled-coil domain-containing protein 14 n=1 Tax=Chaetodon trifascialis TaxID=109706 RepID=UPI003996817F